jgi:hypothetical protein
MPKGRDGRAVELADRKGNLADARRALERDAALVERFRVEPDVLRPVEFFANNGRLPILVPLI